MKNKPKSASDRQKSRRRFTKRLAAALVAAPAVAASVAASAQTTPPAREPKAPPNPQTTPPPQQPPPPPKPSPVAEAYAEVARARFGKNLSDEEFARVKRDLEGNVRSAERLSASKLENSDEPDFIFGA